MIKFIVRCLVFFGINAPALASNSVLPTLYSIIIGPIQASPSKWIKIDQNELPNDLLGIGKPERNQSFFVGFRLVNTRAVVIFEMDKPQLVPRYGFCRSRVTVYQIYKFEPHLAFTSQEKTVLNNFSELDSFDPKKVSDRCRANSVDDLSEYTLVRNAIPNSQLKTIWSGLQRSLGDPRCVGTADYRIWQLGVTQYPHVGHYDDYFALVSKSGEETYSVVHFAVGKSGSILLGECEANMLD